MSDDVDETIARITAERDEARQRALEENAATLRRERDEARGLLKRLEWGGGGWDGIGSVVPVCPSCSREPDEGHWSECELGRALSTEKGTP